MNNSRVTWKTWISGLRCAELGLSGWYVPDAIAYHAGSATLGRWHPDTARKMARNQLLLVAKHYPPDWIKRYGWSVFVAQILWGFVALRHGAFLGYLAGKMEGVRRFRGLRRAQKGGAGKTGGQLSRQHRVFRHRRTGREGNPRPAELDGVRSILAVVFCSNMTRTGVVVVTYNSAEVIERCLDSCGDLPVVVIDNASGDGTCELVRGRDVTLIANGE